MLRKCLHKCAFQSVQCVKQNDVTSGFGARFEKWGTKVCEVVLGGRGRRTQTSMRKTSIILKTTLRERTEANMVRNHGLAYMDVMNSYTHTHEGERGYYQLIEGTDSYISYHSLEVGVKGWI